MLAKRAHRQAHTPDAGLALEGLEGRRGLDRAVLVDPHPRGLCPHAEGHRLLGDLGLEVGIDLFGGPAERGRLFALGRCADARGGRHGALVFGEGIDGADRVALAVQDERRLSRRAQCQSQAFGVAELEDRRHHPLVLVLEDVAVEDVLAGEVEHPESNGHTAKRRHHDHVQRRDVVGGIGIRKRLVGLDREAVDLRDDEHTLMDVERMVERARIEDSPFLDRADLKLGHDTFAKLLAVDVEIVDVDDRLAGVGINTINGGQLLQRERASEVRRRLPERVCRLESKHRRVSGDGISLDDDGRQHVVVASAAHVVPRLFATPSIHHVVGAGSRGGCDRHRHPVARAEQGERGGVLHP